MTPNYVATKSAWTAVNFWLVILFWLIVPLIILIARIVIAKHYVVEFYDEYVIVKSGVLSKNERKSVFPGITSVSTRQSLWGRMCNYGDVYVDVIGKWDVALSGMCNPKGLKEYLEDKTVKASDIRPTIIE